uniref:BAH domain-containing protein n=2 Tax=Araucaria cunninghamii TaxID=56994 RepID=A0A0D6QWS5_ARACU
MAPPTAKSKHFVKWEEESVSNDRGHRVVHYYLKDRHGNASLAVVGTEKSLRHMVYEVQDEFLHLIGHNNKSIPCSSSSSGSSSSIKWRARREVVDWLTSLLSKPRCWTSSGGDHSAKLPKYTSSTISDTDASNDEEMVEYANHTYKGHLLKKSRTSKEVSWLGAPWICRKHLTHYKSFCRNGVTISVHDFVYIMAEGMERHIAYLEDMFEDTKARKLVRVKWFHKTNEVLENIPPAAAPHTRELFFASACQVLNVECVDGLATVLVPEHYQECMAKLTPETAAQLHMCYRQFDNDVIKPFDISQLEGYWHQEVLSSMDLSLRRYSPKHELTSDSLDVDEEQETVPTKTVRKGPRKSRSSRRRNVAPNHYYQATRETASDVSDSPNRLLVHTEADRDLNNGASYRRTTNVLGDRKEKTAHGETLSSFDIGERLELLSQDSGIRGCWFRCVIVNKESHRLKVRYEDVLNEDESDNLEEWVPAYKAAAQDKLGIRTPGRLAMRPYPPENKFSGNIKVGTAVDAWWNDGWWEGVVIKMEESSTEAHVYLPGENETQIFQTRDLRISRDWVNNQWTSLEEAPNLPATLASLDKKAECTESAILSRGCTISPAKYELDGLVASTDGSLVSSVAGREFSKSDEVKNNDNGEKNVEVKEEIGVDLGKNEKEKLACNLANDGLLGDLRWKTSRKRSRDAAGLSRGSPSRVKHSKGLGNKTMDAGRTNNEVKSLLPTNKKEVARRQKSSEGLVKAKKLRQRHENLKPIHGCPIGSHLFTTPMPLSNLVMSR